MARRKERLAHSKRYREENKEKVNACIRNHYENNPDFYKAKNAKRRASKLQRTPSWADDLVIQMIYEDAPEGMEVDHIIPLQGKTVSGLHVAWNLQYLTPEENKMKGNRYE